MNNPTAVLISDIHFNLNTLEIASKALKAAISKAEELEVPVIIAGDLQDTKATIRGEVANRLIDILATAGTDIYILVGNHDLINEKGVDNALNYLQPNAILISEATHCEELDLWMLPYYSDAEELKKVLKTIPKGSKIIMHQGFLGAQMGDYIQDKTSISTDEVKDFIVISGHYHRHQTVGTVTYIGSPYTITFGEANDGLKGFLVLNQDGTFIREYLGLRRHIKLECAWNEIDSLFSDKLINSNDLLWLKITGPQSELLKINKQALGLSLLGHANYKLDLIGIESGQIEIQNVLIHPTDDEVLDQLIDSLGETDLEKQELKQLWRRLL